MVKLASGSRVARRDARIRSCFIALCAVIFSTFGSAFGQQTVWHVDDDAGPGGNGLDWGQGVAFDDLQDAINVASSGDQIWVATGVYTPSAQSPFGGGTQGVTFTMPEGVQVYGGFDATEDMLSERAGLFGQTILSGLLATTSVHHVVLFNDVGWAGPEVRLDGFKIEAGSADSDLVTNGNKGGGILLLGSKARIDNITIRDNSAARTGGGMYVAPSTSHVCDIGLLRCSFVGNLAGVTGGRGPRDRVSRR